MEWGPWSSVKMGPYCYRVGKGPVFRLQILVAFKRGVMLRKLWPMALFSRRKTLVLFALNWLILSAERCCGLIRPRATVCPAILTTTQAIPGRRAHVFMH